MNLVMYEIKKISMRRIVITGLIILFIGIIYNFISSYLYYDTYILTEDKSKIEATNGKQANEIRKNIENQFLGEVDEQTIGAIEQFLQKEEQNISHLSEDQKKLYMLKYSNLSSLINTNMREFDFGYCRGWQKFIINFSNTFSIFIIIYLVVIFYKIFICEKENEVEEIVYSTKMARKYSVRTRIFIVNTLSFISYSTFYAINLLIHIILYGCDGAKVGIQSIAIFSDLEYSLSVGEMTIFMFIEGMLATSAISMIICVCSCYGKNTFSILLSSLIMILAPIFFDFSNVMPGIQKILVLLPTSSLSIVSQYKAGGLYCNSIMPVILSGAISIGIILSSFWYIKQYFRHYSLHRYCVWKHGKAICKYEIEK